MLSKNRSFIVQGDSWTNLAFKDSKSHVHFKSFLMVLILNRLVQWFTLRAWGKKGRKLTKL